VSSKKNKGSLFQTSQEVQTQSFGATAPKALSARMMFDK